MPTWIRKEERGGFNMSKVDDSHVGHCGLIFKDFQVCDEPKLDDLCLGCPYNDEEEYEEEEWEEEATP